MDRQRILIIGPISESGGREINSIFFIEQFQKKYEVTVFSTIPVSSLSIVDEFLCPNKMISFERIALENPAIKFFAKAIKRKNRLQCENVFLVKNKISSFFFNFDKLYEKTLYEQISKQDIVFYSGLLSDKWLPVVSKICKQKHKKLIVRITGSFSSEMEYSKILKEEKIVVHSFENLKALINEGFKNVRCIEQSSRLEKDLLSSDISVNFPLKFGYLGRMSHEKGLEVILESFKRTKLELVIAGSGPLGNKIADFASKNSNIKKIGFIPHINLPKFLNSIDVLLIASRNEGGPLVGIEAMAAGKLVLSTKVGAMPQRLNFVNKELLIDDSSEVELCNAIDILLQKTESDIYDLKRQMRKYYLNYASNEIVMNKYFQFIES
ncbi:glycosyltransferase [Tamlana crocina]|uniref:Glycosyltransferase family 4 protein n=1 Tax=Tamlana crocina TaxID=393006 RepID=A0ABX1D9J5_9FLAO|nr:glycosyltransferase [Tamlana crocina]NJX15040.1 glycosyltransferase family 4 protein [Tamlana crocina]